MTRLTISIWITLIYSIFCIYNSQAQVTDLPIKTIGETEFYVYEVQNKESIYGICKKFQVSKNEIIKYNPSVADGIKKGQKLFIPVEEGKTEIQPVITNDNRDNFNHIIQRGETLYGIAKMYNVTEDEILQANPIVVQTGIKAGDILTIPQVRNENIHNVDNSEDSSILFYTLKKDDTLYSLSSQYNTSIKSILLLNPGLSPTDYKEGDVIRIRPNEEKYESIKKNVNVSFEEYVTDKNESYESVAQKFGVEESNLRNANDGINTLKKNTTIYVPVSTLEECAEDTLSIEDQHIVESNMYDSLKFEAPQRTDINITLILPFMLNTEHMNKQATLYTEFYKGFLLAIDSLKHTTQRHITINVFDSEDSFEKVKKILADTTLVNTDIIFAPNDMQQLELICSFAKLHEIKVVNPFIVKNDFYNEVETFYQINTPQSFMYAKVCEEFYNLFQDYHIIFVSQESVTEKDFIPELRNYLSEKQHQNITELKIESPIMPEDLDSIMSFGEKYVFVPTSGSKKLLSMIHIGVNKLKNDNIDKEIKMFGYPEWITYMNEYKDSFRRIDTYIFSRFFANEESDEYKNFVNKYIHWYGEELENVVPRFGVLGFDMGMYFVGTAISDSMSQFRYNGIQTDIEFRRVSNWGGFINDAIYIINLTPDLINKISK